jgi:Uma2 family endonuclease
MEQRLVLDNVSWRQYVSLGDSLQDRPGLRMTYDRGRLEIHTTSSPPAPLAWTALTQRFLFHDIDWRQYGTILEAIEQQHLRTTYDRGSLELMTLSSEHERYKNLLRMLIQVLAEECRVRIMNLGSTTCRSESAERGLEADECYYTKNWLLVRGKDRLDLSVDPPPDLAVEIDITHSSLDRMKVYASLRIPEVWRFNGQTLTVYVLGAAGQHEPCEQSPTFPDVSPADLAKLILQVSMEDDATAAGVFRAWIREQLAKKSGGQA